MSLTFKVTALPSLPAGLALVERGAQIGFLETPMAFRMDSLKGDGANVIITFTVKKDPSKTEGFIEADALSESGIHVRLYNLFPNTTVSLSPLDLLYRKSTGERLLMQFMVLRFGDADHFLFYYEFHEKAVSSLQLMRSLQA